VNNEMTEIRKKTAVPQFEVSTRDLYGKIEENHEKPDS
jgi:hypothetical protein